MEGLVYQFKPTLAKDYIKNVGGVDADNSYKILMDPKTRWGRLNEPDVNVDRESFRNSTIAKQAYIRLAQSLVNIHKYDSAVKVLDKGLYFFPGNKFPYDYFTTHWAMLYYQAGATEKANKLSNAIFDRYMDDLRYYNSLDDNLIAYYSDNIREALTSLQQLGQLAKDYGQKKLEKKMEKAFYDEIKLMQAVK